MSVPSVEAAALPALTDAERARQRFNRIALAAPDGERRVRDGDAAAGPRRAHRHGTGKREGFRLGWFGWLAINGLAVALVLGAVLAWPPVSACREQEAKVGFYAGDTLSRCIHRGVAARIEAAEQRIKMAMRGSGR